MNGIEQGASRLSTRERRAWGRVGLWLVREGREGLSGEGCCATASEGTTHA
jgi:hypothetical protein